VEWRHDDHIQYTIDYPLSHPLPRITENGHHGRAAQGSQIKTHPGICFTRSMTASLIPEISDAPLMMNGELSIPPALIKTTLRLPDWPMPSHMMSHRKAKYDSAFR
jgi:hypothetical protein